MSWFFLLLFFFFSHGRIKVKKNLPSIKTYFLFYFILFIIIIIIIIILYIIFLLLLFLTKQMHLLGRNWVLTLLTIVTNLDTNLQNKKITSY